LGDDHVLWLGSEELALFGIQVHIVGIDIPLTIVSRRAPGNAKFHIVVLESNEGKGGLEVFAEREAEGVESRSVGTTEKVTRDGLGRVCGGEHRGDEGGVGGVLVINDLTTHEEFDLIDLCAPVGGTVSLGRGAVIGDKVHIAEEIPLAFKANGGHTPIRDIPLDHLAFHSLGEVCVSLVG
jgi:hypothetical protein